MLLAIWTGRVVQLLNSLQRYGRATYDQKRAWIIHGVAYDMESYVKHHPGGQEAILLGQGRDCTALFESYHPFTQQHVQRILQKYRISPSKNNKLGGEKHTGKEDVFYEVLKKRVADSLIEQGLDPIQDRVATWQRWAYYCIVLVVIGISAAAHGRGSLLGSFSLAVVGWLVGALGHDAGHYAASRRPFVNDIGVWAISILCNPIIWQHQHTYAHHSHTNQLDHDPDLYHFETFLRVHCEFKQKQVYKYQSNWLFVAFAYLFVCVGTCLWIPLLVIRDGCIYGMVEWTDKRRPLRAIGLWVHWILYIGFILAWPYVVHDDWLWAWASGTIHMCTSGLIFASFSQINHLNETSLTDTNKPRDPDLKDSWAAAQVEASNNFCPHSLMWHFLSNGLNLQIEHHLFPGLNHCHLPRIQPIVQATCNEFGVHYKSYDSWSDIMGATLEWLDKLAVETQSNGVKEM